MVLSGGEFDKLWPVAKDFGLIQAPLRHVCDALISWHRKLGLVYQERPFESLAPALESLSPLSAERLRKLFVPTQATDWTAYFESGFDGSDPFPTMSYLAEVLDVTAMRVCRMPSDARWPGVAWEVYSPPSAGGTVQLHYRRSIAALNDGGRWVFNSSGEPFPFEDLARYQMPKKRDRFTAELLERYLREFGLFPFSDDFYEPSPARPAVRLERNSAWKRAAPGFTLAEVHAGLPWKKA